MTVRNPGRFQNRYAMNSTSATRSGVTVSERPISSLIHTLGYTANRAAAIKPTLRPAISRPVRPPTAMAPAPMTQHQILWAK